MIEFVAALYNEEAQIEDLINHVYPIVDTYRFVDDGSTDGTVEILDKKAKLFDIYSKKVVGPIIYYTVIQHTGLPETVKNIAVNWCADDSWIIMLDADERFSRGALKQIRDFIKSPASENYTHIWFNLEEGIDGVQTRYFLKCRVFRKSAVSFSDSVHVADSFSGTGYNGGWTVLHYKTSAKQILREKEYLETYKKLVEEGKMTEEEMNKVKSYHYFVR